MEKFIFLTKNNSDSLETIYYAIPESQIEDMDMADIKDEFGQRMGSEVAGDGITLLTIEAALAADKAWNDFHSTEEDHVYTEKFSIGDYISAYEYSLVFEAVINNCNTGVDYEESFYKAQGFSYWNGHNHVSITIDQDFGEPTHLLVQDKALIKRLRNAISKKQPCGKSFGINHYKYGSIEIDNNYCQGSWATYEIKIN